MRHIFLRYVLMAIVLSVVFCACVSVQTPVPAKEAKPMEVVDDKTLTVPKGQLNSWQKLVSLNRQMTAAKKALSTEELVRKIQEFKEVFDSPEFEEEYEGVRQRVLSSGNRKNYELFEKSMAPAVVVKEGTEGDFPSLSHSFFLSASADQSEIKTFLQNYPEYVRSLPDDAEEDCTLPFNLSRDSDNFLTEMQRYKVAAKWKQFLEDWKNPFLRASIKAMAACLTP